MNNPTEKQKTLSEQSVYGDLYGIIPITDMCLTDFCVCRFLSIDKVEIGGKFKQILDKEEGEWGNEPTPYLRPLSDLTKEISHRGYNNDQPFIPMLDWAKKQHPKYRKYEIIDGGVTCDDAPAGDTSWARCSLGYGLKSNEEMDYLNMLHFDTRNLIQSGEAIDANTLNINPYSV